MKKPLFTKEIRNKCLEIIMIRKILLKGMSNKQNKLSTRKELSTSS
jgi:hypothetical protein